MHSNRLVLVSGEEGAGKSTVIRALLPHTPDAARIDAVSRPFHETAGAMIDQVLPGLDRLLAHRSGVFSPG